MQDGSSPVMNGGNMNSNYRRQMAPKNAVHSAAVKLAIPLSEREERINYLDEYSCKPPPLFLICISLAQVSSLTHVLQLDFSFLHRDGVLGSNEARSIKGDLEFHTPF